MPPVVRKESTVLEHNHRALIFQQLAAIEINCITKLITSLFIIADCERTGSFLSSRCTPLCASPSPRDDCSASCVSHGCCCFIFCVSRVASLSSLLCKVTQSNHISEVINITACTGNTSACRWIKNRVKNQTFWCLEGVGGQQEDRSDVISVKLYLADLYSGSQKYNHSYWNIK